MDFADQAFFTGKPEVEELGYSFLFRNYRSENAKWQTADPLGYPDGLNNFAYVNNGVNEIVDPLGLSKTVIGFSSETLISGPENVTNFEIARGGPPATPENHSIHSDADNPNTTYTYNDKSESFRGAAESTERPNGFIEEEGYTYTYYRTMIIRYVMTGTLVKDNRTRVFRHNVTMETKAIGYWTTMTFTGTLTRYAKYEYSYEREKTE